MQSPTSPVRPDPGRRLDTASLIGLIGVFAWLLMFAVIEYAHDKLMAGPAAGSPWFEVYEISAGYVLGFVTALAAWLFVSLLRGNAPEVFMEHAWLRWSSLAGLTAVIAACLAGLVSHNLAGVPGHDVSGLTLTYDLAFLVALAVVAFGVVPLYRRLGR
jgi:hypothetical protein